MNPNPVPRTVTDAPGSIFIALQQIVALSLECAYSFRMFRAFNLSAIALRSSLFQGLLLSLFLLR